MKLKAYNWVLEGLGALVILVGVIIMIIQGMEEVSKLVVQVVGLGVLFFTLMRIKPILESRNEKDYIIIMVLEFIITLVIAFVMLLMADKVSQEDKFINFSRLTGTVLYLRGIIHFYTTSKRYELHDLVAFFVNVLFISFGFLFLFNALKANYIVWVIYVLSFLLVGFFTYRSYNGYRNFRLQKENALKMQNYLEKQKEEVIDDPKRIEDEIHPEVIEEPKEERPSINVN